MKYIKHFYVNSNFYLLGLGFESKVSPVPQ